MKSYFKNMKTITKVDYATYLGVILAFIVVSVCQSQGLVNRSVSGMLVPICAYVCMSISLNLTVGILGELSLGHAGFMSVGAFSGIIAAMGLQSAIPNDLVRMVLALVVGAFFAAIVGFIVGIPVLRLRGDYLAIVTLAFGEIIKDLINCLLVGWDENGLHIALNVDGTKSMSSLGLSENGIEIIKGAQGATGNARIATFTMGFVLVMITLVVVLNLMIGQVTPPFGVCLFVISDVNKLKLERLYRSILPFLVPLILTLILVTYIPGIVTALPNALLS